MLYLIDGHNLIPKAGLRLDSLDDEAELIRLLREFARLSRREVEAYFDKAPALHAGTRKFGTVKAHFVRAGGTADDAIRARLKQMGKAAKNCVVVSSDHQVQNAARASGAACLSSEEFVKEMRAKTQALPPKEGKGERPLSPEELDEWMKIFRAK